MVSSDGKALKGLSKMLQISDLNKKAQSFPRAAPFILVVRVRKSEK
jgi:hypothetical protein